MMMAAALVFVAILTCAAAEFAVIVGFVIVLAVLVVAHAIHVVIVAPLQRWRARRLFPRARALRRGVDFPCEACQRHAGSYLEDGWFRCNHCRYPGK